MVLLRRTLLVSMHLMVGYAIRSRILCQRQCLLSRRLHVWQRAKDQFMLGLWYSVHSRSCVLQICTDHSLSVLTLLMAMLTHHRRMFIRVLLPTSTRQQTSSNHWLLPTRIWLSQMVMTRFIRVRWLSGWSMQTLWNSVSLSASAMLSQHWLSN